jgi:Ca2+-binding RTX toxin-like protein
LSLKGTTVGFTLNDIGSGPAAASTAGLYLSTHSTITTSDILVGTDSSPSLKAGGTDSESIAWSLPTNLSAGTYHLGVIANATSTVAESNANNDVSTFVTVVVATSGGKYLSGTAGDNILFGLAGHDTLASGGGNNVFVGGNDTMIGGSGKDQFLFNASNQGLDQIYNFHAGDLVDFAAAGFGSHLALGGSNTGSLDPSHFVANATGPTTAAQEFWFNTANHTLYFDSNGSAPGGQVAMAHLQNSYVLHSTDILLV